MAFQAARATQEVTAGVYQTTPPGSAVALLRLTGDNAFPGRAEPIPWGPVRDAAGSNRPIATGSARNSTKGSLTTLLYPSQAKVLLNWGLNATGTPLDLPSVTFDHMLAMADASNTKVYQRQLGAKCNSATLTANQQSQLIGLAFSYDFLNVASITGTDFPTPALSAYPTDQPMVMQQASGNFTLNGARTNFKDLVLKVTYPNTPMYDEGAYPNRIWCGGRDISLTCKFRYVAQTDRTAFNGVTPEACSLAFSDGTNTIAIDLKGQGRITKVDDDLPLGGPPYQGISFGGYLDGTAGTDLSITITP